ncbi:MULTISPECIES: class I adenylate-forming enzyme family protein [Sphingomonas]|uniref:class I adenylate-forming enzyme family protein n=1 Tax=Sphingomonas TaxID=13687 RepID=UPI0006FA048D|nr:MULTISPECIES: class I adenylate-forming enzyme family protein [Sphingomonas]KQM94876.1 fatty acid--CoA ligase [Sphingomonas sp. Leaf226]MDY0968274.1 class I adenylate-forming enzyme family protein [Sphingomonas sp. CFBP9021]USR02057.1 acyl--CoA ligase [Sphingomonas aerolata]
MSMAETERRLTAPGGKFEMETVTIGGVATRVWKNAPPSLRYLIEAARGHGERVFTIYEDERVTYEATWRAVTTLASHLHSLGIGPGDRVALAMRNLPEWPVAFFAATAIGAVMVPLNAWWTGAEMAYGLADSGARVLITDDERHHRLEDIYATIPSLEQVLVSRAVAPLTGIAAPLEDVIGASSHWATLPDQPLPDAVIAPDDDATIFYTSGTTGAPKGALGTHRNMMSNILTGGYSGARSALRRGEMPPEPTPRVTLTVIPLFHVTACSAGMMGVIATGSTMIFMRKWDTVRAMEIIEREKVNVTGGVPTIAWQLIEHPDRGNYDLSSLESIAYGGAPSAPELVRRIHSELGALPGNGWGMTETMATVTHHGAEDYLNRPSSAGPPAPVVDLKIVAEDGVTELPVGEVGELWARGPMIVKGYWNKPEATATTFIDGWVRTGDLARLDEEGFCYIVDRAKDMIIRGGENIYSSEVENVLYAHPAVTDCALIGLPHRTLGEEPVAVVHLAPGAQASEAELQAWVRERLAAFKTPVAIRFVPETLPRNANGKILKKDLQSLFADRIPATAS